MPYQHPKFPPRPHGAASVVTFFDRISRVICLFSVSTLTNGVRRCP